MSTDDSYILTNAYHVSEIKQNDEIIKTAKRIIGAGFVVIVVGVIMALAGKTGASIITTMVGAGCNVVMLVHLSAVVAYDASIGAGTFVMAGAVIEPGVVIGDGCIINTL